MYLRSSDCASSLPLFLGLTALFPCLDVGVMGLASYSILYNIDCDMSLSACWLIFPGWLKFSFDLKCKIYMMKLVETAWL